MKVGGDRRSERIERHAGLILDLVKTTPDLTLVEVRERLMTDRSEWFGISTIWQFFGRHRIALKKDRACDGAGPPGRPEAAP